jgi:hypothetical protein
MIDLSTDNRLPALLNEREGLKLAMATAKDRLAEIDTEIKAKLNGGDAGALPGWRITHHEHNRAGYTVAPGSYRLLKVERIVENVVAALQASGKPAWSPQRKAAHLAGVRAAMARRWR